MNYSLSTLDCLTIHLSSYYFVDGVYMLPWKMPKKIFLCRNDIAFYKWFPCALIIVSEKCCKPWAELWLPGLHWHCYLHVTCCIKLVCLLWRLMWFDRKTRSRLVNGGMPLLTACRDGGGGYHEFEEAVTHRRRWEIVALDVVLLQS